MMKSLIEALNNFNANPATVGKFTFVPQSTTVLRIAKLSRRHDIRAYTEYLCAVITKKNTDGLMVVHDNEQISAIKELYRGQKDVKMTKNQDNTMTILETHKFSRKLPRSSLTKRSSKHMQIRPCCLRWLSKGQISKNLRTF